MTRRTLVPGMMRGGVILLALAVWVNTAWVGDDAYITFRTVQNTWLGFGPRWNVIERVQSYSHPLWFILLTVSYPFINDLYISVLALSFLCSALVVWLILRFAPSEAGAGLAIVLLCSSTAFLEFTSSGLENPLTYLLVVSFWIQFWLCVDRPFRLLRLTFIFSLCALNRADTVLLIGPALAVAVWRHGVRRSFSALTLGLTPLIAWTLFALFYYGFLLPNTVYAKLGGGIPIQDVAIQGLRYCAESLTQDHVTLPTMALAGLLATTRPPRSITFALGLLLYVSYIVWIGGDFMGGRFFGSAFVCAVCYLSFNRRWGPAMSVGLATIAVVAALWTPVSPLRIWQRPSADTPFIAHFNGVVDERTFYYPFTGLIPVLGGVRPSRFPPAVAGARLRGVPSVWILEAVGLSGFYAGPSVHLIDPMGLTDPLLARLPAEPEWRAGHRERTLPAGYEDSIRNCLARLYPDARVVPKAQSCVDFGASTNTIRDPEVARYYDDIRSITQSPVMSVKRFTLIGRMNFGLRPPPTVVR